MEDQSILFEDTKIVLQTIINALSQNEIQISKIENYKIGAERRYMELYESELLR